MTLEYKAPNRITGLETDTETATTFEDFFTVDNFTSSDGAVFFVNTTTNRVRFDMAGNTEQDSMINDRTSVSDSAWVLRSRVRIDGLVNNADATPHYFLIGMSSHIETTQADIAQDFIGFEFRNGSNIQECGIVARDGAGLVTTEDVLFSSVYDNTTEWYIEIIRLSTTTCRISIYLDQGYSELLESHEFEFASTIQTLRYIKLMQFEGDGTPTGVLNGFVSNVQFWNSVTSVVSKPTDVPNFTVFDETDTSVRQTYYGNKNYIPINTRFDSYYQHKSPFTILQKQHFWEFFTGKGITNLPNSLWTLKELTGTGHTGAMQDAVDGGFRLETTGGGASDAVAIDFNLKRQYEPTGAVLISKYKRNTTTTDIVVGFAGTSATTPDHMIRSICRATQTNYELQTKTNDSN